MILHDGFSLSVQKLPGEPYRRLRLSGMVAGLPEGVIKLIMSKTTGYVRSRRTPGILHIRVMNPRADPWGILPPEPRRTLRN